MIANRIAAGSRSAKMTFGGCNLLRKPISVTVVHPYLNLSCKEKK
jgi:hypothetical protein